MLTEMDDYFIHQTIDTFDHAFTSDPRFQDRNYFNVHPRDNLDTLMIMGLGNFPNTAIMDGYVQLRHGDMQRNLRVSRRMYGDRHRLEVGPFRMVAIEPWKTWQMTLQPGEHGFSFDLTFTARTLPFEHTKPIYLRANGATVWHQIHVQQSSNYSGWLEIDGTRIPVDGLWGSRDRSWGVRGPIHGAPPAAGSGPGERRILWMSAQFDDCAVHTWSVKMADGTPFHTDGAVSYTDGRVSAPFVRWDEELVASPGSNVPDYAITTLVDSEGKEVRLVARRARSVYLSGNQMNDGKGFGFYRGELYSEHETWNDLPERFPAPPRSADNLCSFEWNGKRGSGVYESPVL